MKSWSLVIIQFACLGYFFLSGPLWSSHPALIALQLTGVGWALWAVFEVRPLKVSVFPKPRPDARLVTSGPFRWVRHPMYTGLLLFCLALFLDRMRWDEAVAFTVLLVNQVVKLRHEEKLLGVRFPEYEAYKKRSWRFFPFVY